MSNKWFGILLETGNGCVDVFSKSWNDIDFENGVGCVDIFSKSGEYIKKAWKINGYSPSDIIFMVRGPQRGVDLILADIKELYCALKKSIPAIPPPTSGDYYIYVYHDHPASWGSVFYVGKGVNGRYLAHLNTVYRLFGNIQPAAGVVAGTTAKERKIEVYLRTASLACWVADQNNIKNRLSDAKKQPHMQNSPALVRVIQAFTPVLAGDAVYSEARAYAAENFLINYRYSIYDISNDTTGNSPGGFDILSRPKWYDKTNPSLSDLWEEACGRMVCEGSLSTYRKAQLHRPAAVPFVAAIDQGVAGKLNPYQQLNANNPIPHHLTVAGAGDVILSYHVVGRCYYLEMKFSRTEPSIGIALRRAQGIKKKTFSSYIQHHSGLPPSNVGNDPYFRAFNHCGGRGGDVRFGIDKVFGGAGFATLSVEPNVATGGTAVCKAMTLFDAVDDILQRFP